MRPRAAPATVLLAACGLVGSLALPWYGLEPASVDAGAWAAFVDLLERQRTLDETVRGWSAPSSAGPLLALAALCALTGVTLAGSATGRALLAVGSVGALGLCAAALLRVPAEYLELRIGVWVSLACALLLLSGARRASA